MWWTPNTKESDYQPDQIIRSNHVVRYPRTESLSPAVLPRKPGWFVGNRLAVGGRFSSVGYWQARPTVSSNSTARPAELYLVDHGNSTILIL